MGRKYFAIVNFLELLMESFINNYFALMISFNKYAMRRIHLMN